MPILDIQAINKRDQLITLDTGTVLSISVEQIYRVNFYMNGLIVGHLWFESLSSQNNLEINPVYKVREESFGHPALTGDASELREAGIALYRAYTNGKILRDKENQVVH
ncbi:hypothetical protein ACKF11_05140 [Methylobacillus sp. Pita2]|jgi:hypothetical protein|uniref:hypothetical protein n=1 Tax=Methylobacillus TaxID=404 RepID=UPI002853A6A4|nr:hypothetical protein [Methylobacillus flagellatus]MDR5171953.1 hypothetical protein [Methylobacillus flagellatus]